MEFIRFLRQESGAYGTRIAAVTVAGGLASGLMMIVILAAASTATDATLNLRYLAMFAIVLTAILLAKHYSLNHTTRLTEGIVERMRIRISDKIRRAELEYFETIGPSEFTTVLTKETLLISSTASATINAAASAIMLLVAFLFIAWLSVSAFVITLAAILFAVAAYRHSFAKVNAQMHETVATETRFFDVLHHLLAGFKELKMDDRKNRDLFDHQLIPLSAQVRDLKIKTNREFVNTTIVIHAAFYALVAAVIFLLPKLANCDLTVILQVTAVILFIFGPLAEVVGVVPQIARASVSIETIRRIEGSLDAEAARRPPLDLAKPTRPWPCEELAVEDLTFSYTNADGTPGYRVGPLTARLGAGKIVFIQGGNGSGKSTFLKLLTGLYHPQSGNILVDGRPLQPSQSQRYRSMFSAIFTDFHLFDRLYGLEKVDEDQVETLLDQMELSDKTSLQEGRFTRLNLSTGQRKRLALVAALLENKRILVFDEWAADQDPEFRRYFYETILRDLKKQGKTVIAATHDDRFFDVADQVLKMEYGRFVDDGRTAAAN